MWWKLQGNESGMVVSLAVEADSELCGFETDGKSGATKQEDRTERTRWARKIQEGQERKEKVKRGNGAAGTTGIKKADRRGKARGATATAKERKEKWITRRPQGARRCNVKKREEEVQRRQGQEEEKEKDEESARQMAVG